MFTRIASFFRLPTADEIRAKMLAETERQLLEAENTLESATATRDMYRRRLARLEQPS